MTDTTTVPPATVRAGPSNGAQVAGAAASGTIAYGLSTLIKVEANRHGFPIDDVEANALVPLLIVFVHPLGQLVNAAIGAVIRKLNGET